MTASPRQILVAQGLAFAAVICLVWPTTAQGPALLSVQAAVERYARGEFATAVRDLDTRRLMVAPFTRALDTWIARGDPDSAPRRRLVAAAFGLDAVWAATRTPLNHAHENLDPWKRITPDDPERWLLRQYLAQGVVAQWAVQQLPATFDASSLDRIVWLAAVGIAEDGHAWYRLQHQILPLAGKSLPGEPRLRLAEVLARTNRDLGSLRFDSRFRRSDLLRHERLPAGVIGRIPAAIRAFEPLLADEALAGEVELRIGYLELRRDHWPEALARFEATRAKATEPTLRAAADYFTGWIHEHRGQPDEAITPYRRAIAITPTMRHLALRLSALLYLRHERLEAYAVLDRAVNAEPAPLDLLVAVERADARFVPEWLTSIRRGLR